MIIKIVLYLFGLLIFYYAIIILLDSLSSKEFESNNRKAEEVDIDISDVASGFKSNQVPIDKETKVDEGEKNVAPEEQTRGEGISMTSGENAPVFFRRAKAAGINILNDPEFDNILFLCHKTVA